MNRLRIVPVIQDTVPKQSKPIQAQSQPLSDILNEPAESDTHTK